MDAFSLVIAGGVGLLFYLSSMRHFGDLNFNPSSPEGAALASFNQTSNPTIQTGGKTPTKTPKRVSPDGGSGVLGRDRPRETPVKAPELSVDAAMPSSMYHEGTEEI